MTGKIDKKTQKKTEYLGYTTYLILAIFALIFYKERTAFLDMSFHLFYILKDGTYTIQNYRFGAFVTQSFPLVGAKFGLSLKSIMQLYSVGFVLFYAAIFTIIIRLLKSVKFAIIMLLFSTLMVTHTFYWIQSELPQGIALMILYFAFLKYMSLVDKNRDNSIINIPVIVVSSFVLAFIHPLMIFPVAFVTFYFIIIDSDGRKLYLSSFISFFAIYILKSIFFKTEYDSGAMKGIINIFKLFPNYFTLQSNKNFIHYIINDYYLLIATLLVVLGYYISKKNYLKALLVAFFFFGYLLLVNVSYPAGAENFYMENLYLPLAVFVIFPLVFDLFVRLRYKILWPVLILILAIRITDIYFAHPLYSDRVQYIEDYIEKVNNSKQKKQIIDEKLMSKDTLLMSWASPYEFWLLSTIKTGKTLSIFITDDINAFEWGKNYNKKFLTKWGTFDYSELPSKYFIMKDSSYYSIKK